MYIQYFLWQIKHTARQTLLEITVTVSEYKTGCSWKKQRLNYMPQFLLLKKLNKLTSLIN